MHIAFLTLFLGLVAGRVPVELAVSGGITSVELTLDGAPAGRLAPPFRGEIDFGTDLLPHHLVARGFARTRAAGGAGGAGGDTHEVDRAERWVNLPQPWARVEVLLEARRDGRLGAVRLDVQSRTFEPPREISARLDGKPLPVTERRVALPAYDAKVPHLLAIEAPFGNGFTARRDIAFGGGLEGEVSTDLTAVLVRPRRRMPALPELRRSFTLTGPGGNPAASKPAAASGAGRATPTAVEEGLGDIVAVRDPAAIGPLRQLGRQVATPQGVSLSEQEASPFLFDELPIGPRHRLRFIDPSASAVHGEGQDARLFDLSQEVDGRKAGLYMRLAYTLSPQLTASPQVADAVAVAGVQALVGQRRRAVLLVVGGRGGTADTVDSSRFSPAEVRRYLAALRVPLHVWSLTPPPYPPAIAAWGDVLDVSSLALLRAAHGRLLRDLNSQRIVWLAGRHLPQAIGLTLEAAARLELVSGPRP